MKRYALRSCKPKPSVESCSERLVDLGDTMFPVANRDSLENGMGMGMRLLVSALVGLVVGIITKFFTSSKDEGAGQLTTSVASYDNAVAECKAKVEASLGGSSSSPERVRPDFNKLIAEEMWLNEKVQRYIRSNLFAIGYKGGRPDYTLIEMTRQLCESAAKLSSTIDSSLMNNKSNEAVQKALATFEQDLIHNVYDKLMGIRKILGLHLDVEKDVLSIMTSLNEANNALRTERAGITDHTALTELAEYVKRNQWLNLEPMTVGALKDLSDAAKLNMDAVLLNMTSTKKHLERDEEPEDSEYTQATKFLGQLSSLCGKYLSRITKLTKDSEKLLRSYTAAVDKVAKDHNI